MCVYVQGCLFQHPPCNISKMSSFSCIFLLISSTRRGSSATRPVTKHRVLGSGCSCLDVELQGQVTSTVGEVPLRQAFPPRHRFPSGVTGRRRTEFCSDQRQRRPSMRPSLTRCVCSEGPTAGDKCSKAIPGCSQDHNVRNKSSTVT